MYSSSCAGEYLAGGVVGGVQDDGLGARREGAAQLFGIEGPIGRAQRDVARLGAAELGVGPVVFVEGLEEDHFVAGVEHRQQAGDHALGGAAADGDFALGVDLHAVGAPILGGDGVAEGLGAPGDRVLVDVGVDGVVRRPA